MQGESKMRNLGSFAALSLITAGLAACGNQEPAAAPLAPPPPATVAPAPLPMAELKKEEPKPVPLTAEQKTKFYQEGWAAFNAKDFAKFKGIWADNATSEALDMGPPLVGPAAITDTGAKGFATAFPDGNGEVQLTLINGNNIVGVVLMRGTQAGTYVTPLGPVPATGKKVGFLSAHSIELNDAGKAVKEVLAYDGGTVAGQLGLMPMPHRKVIETGWTDKPVVIASGSEAEKTNLAAVLKEVDAFNKHDAAGALGSADDKVVFSDLSAPADRVGKKESQKGIEEMFKAFPDAKLDMKSTWAAGDYVVATGVMSGTNTADSPAMHLKKTGKAVSLQFIEIDKFSAGKTTNIWMFANGAAMAGQLGLIPPAKAAAEPKAKEAKPPVAKGPAPKSEPAMKPAPAMKADATPATTPPPAMKPATTPPPAMKPARTPPPAMKPTTTPPAMKPATPTK
jgi:predicted ester cyclase